MTEWTKRRQRTRERLVSFGVYIAVVLGVCAQSMVSRFDVHALEIDLDFTGWSVPRIVLAILVATTIYWRLDGKEGNVVGKSKNVGRVLTLGFTSGWTLMGITGIGG